MREQSNGIAAAAEDEVSVLRAEIDGRVHGSGAALEQTFFKINHSVIVHKQSKGFNVIPKRFGNSLLTDDSRRMASYSRNAWLACVPYESHERL